MKKKEPVYVTGHQHPDTDSVASAIAYAFFKKSMGIPAIACRLGKLNGETQYLLNRFGISEPALLTDARVTLAEIEMDPLTYITPETTISESLQQMQDQKHTYCGVIDAEGHLIGLVTKSDISEIGLGDTASSIEVMKRTSLGNICKTINGKIIYDDPAMKLNGKVSIITMTEPENLCKYDVAGRIVICGAHEETQKEVIRMGAGALIVVWTESVDESVIEVAKEHHCPILISGHGSMNTSRYIYFSPSVKEIMKKDLITFSVHELAEDVGAKLMRSRYHIYPVVDEEQKLVGYVSRYHIMHAVNKQIILVDHNEFSQSVRAIEKARILEVIDHHRINDFASTQPVQFRNEIVGSTATVVATIFRENQIPVPKDLAGLLLGAILSDTLNFHSPTTTKKDKVTANILAAMADLEIDEFAKELFTAAAETEELTAPEMIKTDMKIFEIAGLKVSISQAIVPSAKNPPQGIPELQRALERFATKKNLDLSVMTLTSILEDGSIFLFGGERAPWGKEAFPDKPGEEHSIQNEVFSRKQQILPALTEVIERYCN
ncbi:MAG: putative manganese-dependent inorganic diphosphatase [Lachnospiraceae bacterium]|nr:putative manganese-dependent inorganic diphosphatase [Lachnospiraceae bacterium]